MHGKGIYYRCGNNIWELNNYEENKMKSNIKGGEGLPQHLHLKKEHLEEVDLDFKEIYIKPKDFFFDHFEVNFIT